MYTGIARVYDRLNEDVDYEKWADYVTRLFNKYGCKPDLVLELACGTGSFAIIMSKKGYEMICVDISEEMLTEAGQKAEAAGQNILFLQQDMTSFELYGTVGAIVCLLDSVNHLQDMEDVKKMLRLCYNYLDPGGLLIFDVNTLNKLENIYGDNVFYVDEEDFTCIWQCEYDPNERRSFIDIVLFQKLNDLYQKFEDTIIETAFDLEDLKEACTKAGFVCEGMFDEFTFNPYTENSERVFYIVRKSGEKNK
jgi:ubiquinone/menaquinone biosynthesis C-methylase UbiE